MFDSGARGKALTLRYSQIVSLIDNDRVNNIKARERSRFNPILKGIQLIS